MLKLGMMNFYKRLRLTLKKAKGFTIIEMAIVLVIVGLLIGLSTPMIRALTNRTIMSNSRDITKTAYESVIGYAISNKKLPDPATLATLIGARTTDAYNRTLKYYAVSELIANSFCANKGTYLLIDDSSSGATISKTDIAFLIFSEGQDRTNSTGVASTFTVLPQSNTYDDIVYYLDINTLRQKACNTFKIVTDSLPIATVGNAYLNTTLGATDGTAPLTWSIASGSLPNGLSLSGAGVISGTPTAAGSFPFEINVHDDDAPQKQVNKTLSITVNP
jgi:prepilin-type N-terminal cleavage/methylation domain-containing protein